MNKGTWLGSLPTLVAVTVAGVPAAAQQPKKGPTLSSFYWIIWAMANWEIERSTIVRAVKTMLITCAVAVRRLLKPSRFAPTSEPLK